LSPNVEQENVDDPPVPEPGDYVISEVGPLRVVTQVTYFEDGHLGSYGSQEEAEEAIRQDMGITGVRPNVWRLLGHGNYQPSALSFEESRREADAEVSSEGLEFLDGGQLKARLTKTHLVTGFGPSSATEEWPLKKIYGVFDGRNPIGDHTLTVRM